MSIPLQPSGVAPGPIATAFLAATSFLLTGLASPASGQIDSEINRQVWKQKFGVLDAQMSELPPYSAWLSQDADGDGVKNGDEFVAGTNPFKKLPGEAHFRPPSVTASPSSLSLTFPTVPGKLYGLESNDTLVGAWSRGSLPGVAGDGTDKTLVAPKSAGKFFHLSVTDQATQGDMVSDWAKIVLGLSAGSPIGSQTSFDHTSLASNLQEQNVVSLEALDTAGTQPTDASTPAGDYGLIRIARSGFLALGNVTVPISKSGTAVEGVDFESIPSSVTFPAGVSSLDMRVIPLFNAGRTTPATVFLTAGAPGSAGASGNYALGSPASAGVTLYPSGNPNGTGLTGTYFDGSSTTYENILNFGAFAATYSYSKTTALVTVTFSGAPDTPYSVGSHADLMFTSGNLNTAPYNTLVTYDVIAPVTANSFTISLAGGTLPNTSSGNVSISGFKAPVTRLDPVVDFNWLYGTPNGNTFVPADNYSVTWDGWLSPSAAGDYVFRLDADDKARVLIDTGGGLQQILENGWDSSASGDYKTSSAVTLVIPASAAARYPIRVEFVETTGNAKCKLQWSRNGGSFSNIPSTNVFTNNTGTTAGWSAVYYANPTFTPPVARTQTDSAVTNGNNGDWGSGSPDPSIFHNNFTVRWTGQVLPQYTQDYYFVLNADDGVKLWINNEPQILRRLTNDNPSVTYNYTRDSSTNGTVVLTYNSAPIAIGDVIPLSFTSGALSTDFGSRGLYMVTAVSSTTFTVALTGTNLPASDLDNTSKCRIDTTNLIIDWGIFIGVDRYCMVPLQAGVPYDIRLEYYEGTGNSKVNLSWYSEDQPKQIIPTGRLFPTSGGSPPSITSATSAVTVLGSGDPFTMDVTSSNGGTVSSPDLPSWLTLVNGVLSGTPVTAGIYQFTLTTTSGSGASSVVMTIEVHATPNQLTRELWTSGVTGTGISNVPWTSPPSSTSSVNTTESASALGNNTGERLRGYFTAPFTGNYYFWIAASNAAELWISNNSEPVNKVLRSTVSGGTPPKTWNSQPSQKTQWLSLVAGQKYYIEARHNTGANGASSHLSVAWFLDPTGNTASPVANGCLPAGPAIGGLIPGNVLSPWDNPPTTTIPGTLYVTNLQGAPGLGGITGTGGAFLRVNGSSAVLQLDHSGLSSGMVSRKLLNAADEVIFDIGAQDRNFPALKTSDGGYSLDLQPAALTALNQGEVRVVISTVNHPDGELTGTFGITAGSQTAPATPAYPVWTDQHSTSDAANSRFLTQATFGPSPDDMAYVKTNGYRAWINNQFTLPSTHNLPYILANLSNDPQNPYGSSLFFNSWWKNSVTAPDQLRQRMAFALSEILVVSNTGPLNNNGRTLADYYDTLLDHGLGNFRNILKQVTLSSAMGVYLDMRGNAAGNIQTGLHPNENYAREILQLFSAGLYRVWPDGTLVLDSNGNAVPTYDQSVITGMARVFTGWTWGQPMSGGRLPTGFSPSSNYLDPMVLVPTKHELGTKILLDNVVLPAATVTDQSDTSTDPSSSYLVQSTDPVLGAGNLVTTTITNRYDLNGVKDLEVTLDNILRNSATGPYICRQLIQRLVTSSPKPEYVHRVVRAFNGEQNVDGIATGVRGEMKDVLLSILLDPEARSATAAADVQFGKQREPLLRLTAPARSFPPPSFPGSTYRESGFQPMLITTPSPHRLINGETILLSSFEDSTSNADRAPTVQSYSIANTTPSYSLNGPTGIATITAPGYQPGDTVALQFTSGTLGSNSPYNTLQNYIVQSATTTNFTIDIGSTSFAGTLTGSTITPNNFTVNNNSLASSSYNSSGSTVTISSSGYVAGQKLYVKFSSGGLLGAGFDGVYPIATASSNSFTISLGSSPAATSGSVLIPRLTGGYKVTTAAGESTILFQTTGNHNLSVGDQVQINILVANLGTPVEEIVYTVVSVPGPNSFTVTAPTVITSGSQGSNGMIAYPLSAAPLNRSGTVTVGLSTWNVGTRTDNDLQQTPLDPPTVFNFFYPDYRYPGDMAQAGMTTPEFQLTNDSNTMNLTNAVTRSILSAGNPNGYTSYQSGGGAITMDLGPYMTPGFTADEHIPTLVDTLGTLLTGGNLSQDAKDIISNYALTLSYTTPTNTQMRDRVRAIVHLILTSAEFAIQK